MKKYVFGFLALLPASSAFAQDAGAKGFTESLMSFAPIIAIFGIFYFLMIRPQQKKMKLHREMLGNLRRGDRVVTSGGIIGSITKVEEQEVHVEISDDVKVRVLRSTLSQVLDKTAPVAAGSKSTLDKDSKNPKTSRKSSEKKRTTRSPQSK